VADGPECTCGGRIPGGRRDGFCSSWCASRDAQGLEPSSPPPRFTSSSAPTVLAVAGPGPTVGDSAATSPSPAPAGGTVAPDEPRRPAYRLRRRKIADEVEDRLKAAGLLGTWQAAQVLDLADALDWQGGALSARAAAHRELERQMSELLRGMDEPGSAVGGYRDQLAERRRRRAGGA
jgi:hypothetical protein